MINYKCQKHLPLSKLNKKRKIIVGTMIIINVKIIKIENVPKLSNFNGSRTDGVRGSLTSRLNC